MRATKKLTKQWLPLKICLSQMGSNIAAIIDQPLQIFNSTANLLIFSGNQIHGKITQRQQNGVTGCMTFPL